MTKDVAIIKKNIGESMRARGIRVSRRLRPLVSRLPVSLMIVISLISVAISAEAALSRTTSRSSSLVVTSAALERAQARLSRAAATFDTKRATAVAVSPIAISNSTETASDESVKPIECLLKEMVDSLRCQ